MGVPEAVDSGEGEFSGPEPPPAGSIAYRKTILRICAAETADAYEALMVPVWEWRGWRAGVEVMVEMMGAVAANLRPDWVDAYGNVSLSGHIVTLDDEQILRYAAQIAPRFHPDLPRHEAIRRTIQEGEEARAVTRSMVPYWEQAVGMLRTATSLTDLEPARVVFARWLNDHYRDRRLWAASLGAASTHTHWRHRVMPPGDGWVDDAVSNTPDLRGSLGWASTATVVDVARQQPDLVANWQASEEPRPGKGKGGRKGRSKCCPGCGKHRR